METLWDVLLGQGIDPAAAGWTDFTAASGISADGNTIVGWGTRDGNVEAFIAVVPEPTSTATMLNVVALQLLRRRRPSMAPLSPTGVDVTV